MGKIILAISAALILIAGLVTIKVTCTFALMMDVDWAIGVLIGTIFGQVSVASLWSLLGPGRWFLRYPLAFGWVMIVLIVTAFVFHNADSSGSALRLWAMLGCCAFGQWLLIQILLLPIAVVLGIRLQSIRIPIPIVGKENSSVMPANTSILANNGETGNITEESQTKPIENVGLDKQFQLRDLLMFTSVIAGTVLAGKLVIEALAVETSIDEYVAFLFLTACATMISLCLAFAALISRHTVLATLLVVAFGAGFTAQQNLLIKSFSPGVGASYYFIMWINFFACFWVLLMAVVIRLSGFKLTKRAAKPSRARNAERADLVVNPFKD